MIQVTILQVQGNLCTKASKYGVAVKVQVVILPLLASLS